MFRSKSRRERARRQAEQIAHRGWEQGEALRQSLPAVKDRLMDLREQTEVVLHQIEEMYEQAEPALDEGKKSIRHGTKAASLASEISAQPRHGKRPGPLVVVVLALAGFIGWKLWRRRTIESGDSPR